MKDSKLLRCRVQISSERKWGWLPLGVFTRAARYGGEVFLLTSPFMELPTYSPITVILNWSPDKK